MTNRPGQITDLLEEWRKGDASAFDSASDLLYSELHRIAQSYLRGANNTLQPTDLIGEAYLRLANGAKSPFKDRKHFYALAAKIMRQILVDRARERKSLKRGGGVRPLTINEALDGATNPEDFLALDEALTRLADENPALARVIELRYFGGLKIEEVADALDLSVATVGRHQRLAEAWLARALTL